MNYSALTKGIVAKVLVGIAIINNPEIEPEVRQRNMEIFLGEVGGAVYDKVYDMNAFDYEVEFTRGQGIGNRFVGMAKIASDSVSAGGKNVVEQQVRNYLSQMAALAQEDATRTARENGKHPTVMRTTNGDTCKWCQSLAGTYTNPPSEVFARHRDCDCAIETRGYKSRNGLLQNYKKG